MWFIGVEVEQETSAPPPKKNPVSAPASCTEHCLSNNVFRPKISNREDSVQMYGTLQAKGKNLPWVNKAGLRYPRVSSKFEIRYESLKNKFSLILVSTGLTMG